MPHLPDTTDPERWHRYFAVECNNRAWSLAERERSGDEDREMLDAAHAAALHWRAVGSDLEQMRAGMLLAQVNALLGLGPSALSYAAEMRDYFLQQESPDWEQALAQTIFAHAARVAGARDDYRMAYEMAASALAAIVDEEDRRIVRATFDKIPPP